MWTFGVSYVQLLATIVTWSTSNVHRTLRETGSCAWFLWRKDVISIASIITWLCSARSHKIMPFLSCNAGQLGYWYIYNANRETVLYVLIRRKLWPTLSITSTGPISAQWHLAANMVNKASIRSNARLEPGTSASPSQLSFHTRRSRRTSKLSSETYKWVRYVVCQSRPLILITVSRKSATWLQCIAKQTSPSTYTKTFRK